MSNTSIGGTNLPPEDLAALRADLQEQRQFRLQQVWQLCEPATSRADAARTERCASQREVHVKLAASARMVLTDVNAALERMNQGRYGSCHRCAGPIGIRLLRVVPQARYCGNCQHVGEAVR
ncbi:TraR/DksA family transcriptional regulator [Streptomyces hazeniae]|uniref:TraR/DksA family transcriptional regulator n=1 Tax=Streptomyces hazeniae TaxID=3075538 RepID=UPI00374E2009